jgi:heat shock protein HslJ
MKKILLALMGIVVLIVCSFFLLQSISQKERNEFPQPEHVTLQGEYMCLPLKDEFKDLQADCAAGMLTDTGIYYAIDLGLMSSSAPQLVEGNLIKADGVITPMMALSTDYWQKYEAEGIFSITSGLEVRMKEIEAPVISASSSSLYSNSWILQETRSVEGEAIVPEEGEFVLTFTPEGRYTSTTDCNSLSGEFVVDNEVLSLAPPISTKMYCEGSQESAYITLLGLVNSYVIEGDVLRFNLSRDAGTMTFTAQ